MDCNLGSRASYQRVRSKAIEELTVLDTLGDGDIEAASAQ
jgi:hypothetical protein